MAQTLATAGYTVELVDLKQRSDAEWTHLAVRARAEWRANGDLLAELAAPVAAGAPAPPAAGQPPPGGFLHRITLRRGCGPWLRTVRCVFEALPEDHDLKRAAYRELGGWLDPGCLVGSTTSTLTPDALAAALPHPELFLVTHWLNPAWIMPLVEVAPGLATAPAALTAMLNILRHAGKVPVVLTGRAGLAVARLQVLIMNEAARMLAEGVGGAREIDRAVRLGLGFRFLVRGLLEFADASGIDTLYRCSRHLEAALADSRFAPAAAVAEQAQRGDLGAGTGRGFYDWLGPEAGARTQAALRRYLRLQQFLGREAPDWIE